MTTKGRLVRQYEKILRSILKLGVIVHFLVYQVMGKLEEKLEKPKLIIRKVELV